MRRYHTNRHVYCCFPCWGLTESCTHLTPAWAEMLLNADGLEALWAWHQLGAVQFVDDHTCHGIPLVHHTAWSRQTQGSTLIFYHSVSSKLCINPLCLIGHRWWPRPFLCRPAAVSRISWIPLVVNSVFRYKSATMVLYHQCQLGAVSSWSHIKVVWQFENILLTILKILMNLNDLILLK